MKLTRRAVLKFGLGGAVLLAVGGVGLALRGTVLRQPRTALRVLDEREFSILAAVADRIAPGQDGFPSAWSLQVPEKVDALLFTMHPGAGEEMKAALGLLENAAAGLLLEGRTRTFTGSSAEQQDAILASWRDGSIMVKRTAFKALNGLCAATYWSSPEIYEHVGYPGPPPALVGG